MALKFTNFASTTIATATVNPGDTSLAVTAATGNLFPTLGGSDYFYAVIVDSLTAPTKKEVVKVTVRSTDTFTITRAQDGTTAQTWTAGNFIALRLVSAVFADTNWFNIVGTANQVIVSNSGSAITLSLPQSLDNTASLTLAGLSLTGLTASRLLSTNGGKALTSVATLSSWISGTATQITATDNGSGGITLSIPGPIAFATGDTQDITNVLINHGAGIAGLWGPGSGTVARLFVTQTYDTIADPTKAYETVFFQPDVYLERSSAYYAASISVNNDSGVRSDAGGGVRSDAGDAQFYASTGALNGDAYISFLSQGFGSWSLGIDGATSDLVFASSTPVANPVLKNHTVRARMTQAGNWTLNGNVNFGGQLYTAWAGGASPGVGAGLSWGTLSGTQQTAIYSILIQTASGTATGYGIQSRVDTNAAAFTLTEAAAFLASNPSLGVGSSITTYNGFYCQNLATGGTNQIGFHGALTAGSGKYNLYMIGTAQNFLSGDLSVSRAAAGGPVDILVNNTDNGSGTSNARLRTVVGGATGGDALHYFAVAGGTEWSLGLDNSDGDAFVISASAALGTTNVLKLTPTGAITAPLSSFLVTNIAGLGYGTGAGGTVSQNASKSTGVTLNKACGAITMNAAALAAGAIVSFVLTNTSIAVTDVLVLNHISGGTVGSYTLNAQCAAGSATINVRNNTAGSLSEAIVIEFAVIKAVTA